MRFTSIFVASILILLGTPAFSQNLVSNSSFEQSIPLPFSTKISPMFRTFTQSQFNQNSNGFITVYNSTPDFISSDNKLMQFADFGNYVLSDFKAKTGKMALGIRILGCKASDICCREVIQIPLEKPLQTKKKYYIEFWASRMIGSPAIPLSIFFSDTALIENPMAKGHHVKPHFLTDTVVGKKVFEWVKISDTIEAKSNYRFMSIGNFIDDDDKTPQLIIEKGNSFPRSYYFIDDVTVMPLDGYIEPRAPKPAVIMGDVTFNTSESKILPVAFPILDSLARSFLQSPSDTIRLVGHTDNKGAAEMNQQLSINRAQAIKNYLIKKGIPNKQIFASGKGENEPISENETENGRKLNRRVEIFVGRIETWDDKF